MSPSPSDKPIATLDELRRHMPRFLKAVSADSGLALGAAANPILALEETGLRFAPEFRPRLERHIRFRGTVLEKLGRLEQEVHEAAGCVFDLDSPEALDHVLFDQLRVSRPDGGERKPGRARAARAEQRASDAGRADQPYGARLRPSVFGEKSEEDPLERLRDAHPVIKPLLKYRRLEATEPRLAPVDLYQMLRRDGLKRGIRVTRLRAIHKHEENPR